jgi:Flp pilus assembly protein CpaB
MILMVVAVGCGLAASYMTSQLLAERNNGQEEQQEKVKVLVAKVNLEMGLLIKDPKQYFKEKTYTKGDKPTKALTDQDYEQLKDRRLIKPLNIFRIFPFCFLNRSNGVGGKLPTPGPNHRGVGDGYPPCISQ